MKEIDNTVRNAILLKPYERVLILYDKSRRAIAMEFMNSCKKISKKVDAVEVAITQTSRELPNEIVDLMKEYDVILGITKFSLTHTRAITRALKYARVATMPGITKKMFPALNVNYKKLSEDCEKLKEAYEKTKIIHLVTEKGTDVSFYISGRQPDVDNGVLCKKGSLHNLPAGEVGIAPLENKTHGKIVVDVCMVGIEKIKTPITITVRNGHIVRISGKNEASKLRRIFKKCDKNAKVLCEFSIGMNKKAKIIGKVLNDEKSYGTCHVAFGDNINLGGKNKSNIHIDGVINKPTIYFDNKMIMNHGKLIF